MIASAGERLSEEEVVVVSYAEHSPGRTYLDAVVAFLSEEESEGPKRRKQAGHSRCHRNDSPQTCSHALGVELTSARHSVSAFGPSGILDAAESLMNPETRYARTGDVHIAYQVFGSGVDLVFVPGFVSHIDNYWDEPRLARWLRRLGSFAKVIMFDKRGTGLSSRVSTLPTMDDRMDDVRAVMDAQDIERAAIFGISEGGSLASLFAAHHPERCTALILYGAFAEFSSWFPAEESLDEFFEYVDAAWGSGESLGMYAPGYADDLALKQWWGKFERLGGDPKAVKELMQMNSQIDIRDVLVSIHTPTLVIHRTEDVLVDFEGGETLAGMIPDARLVALEGEDHLPFLGPNSQLILDEMEEFLTGSKQAPVSDRMLATVLFTDIVDSTTLANEMGDERWQGILAAHNAEIRREIVRFRGNEIKSLGDGFLATFDGPARAIACALEIEKATSQLGISVRAGLHTGEVQSVDGDIEGIAVHIASRVVDLAGSNEVMVTRTVKDLVAGSGISFSDAGIRSLKGFPEKWQLYRAAA